MRGPKRRMLASYRMWRTVRTWDEESREGFLENLFEWHRLTRPKSRLARIKSRNRKRHPKMKLFEAFRRVRKKEAKEGQA